MGLGPSGRGRRQRDKHVGGQSGETFREFRGNGVQ